MNRRSADFRRLLSPGAVHRSIDRYQSRTARAIDRIAVDRAHAKIHALGEQALATRTDSYTPGVSEISTFLHVSSILNRQSIARHGLDWTRMSAARGIAGSHRPEVEGIFVCRGEEDAEFFFRINNTGGPVDLWSVDGIDEDLLLDNGNGFFYLPGRIPAARVSLVRPDIPPQPGFQDGC